MNDDLTRRNFIAASATGAAATLLARPKSASANDANARLRIGVIGAGNRGFNTLTKTLAKLRERGRNLDLVSVADVYSVHRDRFVEFIKEKTGVVPTSHVDYRDLLAEKDLDADCIATPDHWIDGKPPESRS
ncbi:MAG TPA: twin-arginine translocation signal domain-containing protein [Pirellulales bacterium]|nr:twin-arginine translocation signal domain-containing protein [Pirellulales bacterium]